MKLFTLLTACLFALSGLAASTVQHVKQTKPTLHSKPAARPQTKPAPVKQTKEKPKAKPAEAKEFTWLTDIEKAKSIAKQKSLPIFLYFSGSDWCPHCKKMDRDVLAKPEFQQALLNKAVFVHVDFPKHKNLDEKTKKQNHELKNQFGVKGFPTVLLVDSNLKQIAKPSRKPNPKDFANEVLKHIKK